MNLDIETTEKNSGVRHHFDENSREFYFSIVDVIDKLDLSTDPRNYWKVLKNRLKKGDNKLVTECNQLKMKSGDGKYYLTDVASTSVMLQIIEVISPLKVATFGEFFNQIEEEFGQKKDGVNYSLEKLSTVSYDEGEISVDMYQENNFIFVKAMLAGVLPEDIFISLNSKILILKINRIRTNNIPEENFDYKELHYGKFSRTISLPFEVDIDRVEAEEKFGLLTIKLSVLDKTRTKIIKVK